MEVILLEDVKSLGKKGEMVKVPPQDGQEDRLRLDILM